MTSSISYLNPPSSSPAQGLYSQIAKVDSGSLYFLAGQLAVNRDGEVVGTGDFGAQFHQIFENISGLVREIECTFADIVKFTTYLTHPKYISDFMDLRKDLFASLYPAEIYPPNTLVVVNRLVDADFLIEVEAVVAAPFSR